MKEQKEKLNDEIIEREAIWIDKKRKGLVKVYESEWYVGYRDRKGTLYAEVKDGETFRMANDCCEVCGLHAPLGGGHLFVGKRVFDDADVWVTRTGWVVIGGCWICLECLIELTEAIRSC